MKNHCGGSGTVRRKNDQVLSSSACAASGARLLCVKRTDSSPYVLSEENGQWKTVFRNPHAARENSSVYLDTDELLILSWQEGACLSNTISGGRRRGRSVL